MIKFITMPSIALNQANSCVDTDDSTIMIDESSNNSVKSSDSSSSSSSSNSDCSSALSNSSSDNCSGNKSPPKTPSKSLQLSSFLSFFGPNECATIKKARMNLGSHASLSKEKLKAQLSHQELVHMLSDHLSQTDVEIILDKTWLQRIAGETARDAEYQAEQFDTLIRSSDFGDEDAYNQGNADAMFQRHLINALVEIPLNKRTILVWQQELNEKDMEDGQYYNSEHLILCKQGHAAQGFGEPIVYERKFSHQEPYCVLSTVTRKSNWSIATCRKSNWGKLPWSRRISDIH
jgi:hypothetical protein